ncbi:hypothetical protein ABT297_24255 [Dactylosporangium sp. NPDC000555]|uniref:hypothetical protein n=1 Tax=Dactylosporangium sp. NPDC000555 TaxID=3154260 RepID=UPI003323CAEC
MHKKQHVHSVMSRNLAHRDETVRHRADLPDLPLVPFASAPDQISTYRLEAMPGGR